MNDHYHTSTLNPMIKRYTTVLAVALSVSLTAMSCGVFGLGDDDSGLKIEYEAAPIGNTSSTWKPSDSLVVEITAGDDYRHRDLSHSGSVRIKRDRGETAYVSVKIPSRGRQEGWSARLEVSWGNQRESDRGYRALRTFDPPSVTVPLNEQ